MRGHRGDQILDYGRRGNRFPGDDRLKRAVCPNGVKLEAQRFRGGLRVESTVWSSSRVNSIPSGRAGHLNEAAMVLSVASAAGRNIRLRNGKEEGSKPAAGQQEQQSQRGDPSHRIDRLD